MTTTRPTRSQRRLEELIDAYNTFSTCLGVVNLRDGASILRGFLEYLSETYPGYGGRGSTLRKHSGFFADLLIFTIERGLAEAPPPEDGRVFLDAEWPALFEVRDGMDPGSGVVTPDASGQWPGVDYLVLYFLGEPALTFWAGYDDEGSRLPLHGGYAEV